MRYSISVPKSKNAFWKGFIKEKRNKILWF
jgi:hypothetical protein